MAGYTDYCTCFYDREDNKVYFWDEIKDRAFEKLKVKDSKEAAVVMQEWIGNAPKNIICDCLDDIENGDVRNLEEIVDRKLKKFLNEMEI